MILRFLIDFKYISLYLGNMINEISIETLTDKDFGQAVLDHIRTDLSGSAQVKKPVRIEEALYEPDRCRKKGEGTART